MSRQASSWQVVLSYRDIQGQSSRAVFRRDAEAPSEVPLPPDRRGDGQLGR